MAKGVNQKVKMLYVLDYISRKSNENTPVSMREIIDYLAMQGIKAERKSIYDDIECLNNFGYDIGLNYQGRNAGYSMLSRDFETAELKLLCDAVQSSKFLTEKKSLELIKKLEKQTDERTASSLQREVIIRDRVKSMNNSIYIIIDKVYEAISQNKQIYFYYTGYNLNKQKVRKHSGKTYVVSPYALIFEEEKYYLLGYENADKTMKHFRLDKMEGVEVSPKDREKTDKFNEINLGKRSKSVFGMFDGETEQVSLYFKEHLTDAVIDRFGLELSLIPVHEGFKTTVNVSISNNFFSWVSSFGGDALILSPESVKEKYLNHLKNIQSKYN